MSNVIELVRGLDSMLDHMRADYALSLIHI